MQSVGFTLLHQPGTSTLRRQTRGGRKGVINTRKKPPGFSCFTTGKEKRLGSDAFGYCTGPLARSAEPRRQSTASKPGPGTEQPLTIRARWPAEAKLDVKAQRELESPLGNLHF